MSDVFAIVVGLATLIGLGASFYFVGHKWEKLSPGGSGPLVPTLHAIAVASFVMGWFLTWMAFASDNPQKWRHIALPFVLVAIVYGFALGGGKLTWQQLVEDLRARCRRACNLTTRCNGREG